MRQGFGVTMGAAAVAVVLGMLGGCTNSAGDSGVASAADNPVSAASGAATPSGAPDDGQAFARCAREHGVDMPDPDPRKGVAGALIEAAGSADRATLLEALAACRHLMPQGQLSGDDQREWQEKLLKLAQCLREHGVDVPDPDPSKPRGGGLIAHLNPDDPAVRKALDACEHHITG